MSSVTLISDEHDGTMHYFASFLKNSGCLVRHYYWSVLGASPGRVIQEFVDCLTSPGGLFVREPAQFDLYDCALRDAIFACTPPTINVIAPSLTTTNWSKLLHERTLGAHIDYQLDGVSILGSLVSKRGALPLRRDDRYVIKNISSTPGLTRRVLKYGETLPSDVDPCNIIPALAQEELNGIEYRVHVVDDIALPFKLIRDAGITAVDSPTPCPCEVAELPSSVLQCCVRLTSLEGLRFSGIDLIECAGKGYWLLEVNPMPGYHAYESRLVDLSTPVSDALRNALLRPWASTT